MMENGLTSVAMLMIAPARFGTMICITDSLTMAYAWGYTIERLLTQQRVDITWYHCVLTLWLRMRARCLPCVLTLCVCMRVRCLPVSKGKPRLSGYWTVTGPRLFQMREADKRKKTQIDNTKLPVSVLILVLASCFVFARTDTIS